MRLRSWCCLLAAVLGGATLVGVLSVQSWVHQVGPAVAAERSRSDVSGPPAPAATGAVPGVKYILQWNSFFGFKNLGMGQGTGSGAFENAGCPQRACYITENRTLLPRVEDFDAVVFHMFRLKRPDGFPTARSPHQRYIFLLLESPESCLATYENFPHFFNWTMTYRRDSDIVVPYGGLEPLQGTAAGPWAQPPSAPIAPAAAREAQSRTNVSRAVGSAVAGSGGGVRARVAWLVSRCKAPSRREALVDRLKPHVDLHVYGECGKPWPKNKSTEFRAMLDKNYDFYLSFENSLCRDYVTEKLFCILPLNVVPVVYGGADYGAVAPPHSYIDAQQFASPRLLGDYLNYLVQHPEEYAKFFWWKKHYVPKCHWLPAAQYSRLTNPLCHLCAKLHDENMAKSYADVNDWWSGSNICQKPKKIIDL